MSEYEDQQDESQDAECSLTPVKTMFLFASGDIAAFDENGQQVQELQHKSAIQLWAEFATRLGYDVEGCECRLQAPGGAGPKLILEPTGVTQWKVSPCVEAIEEISRGIRILDDELTRWKAYEADAEPGNGYTTGAKAALAIAIKRLKGELPDAGKSEGRT